ncbi:hypothetical protein [Flavobacterium faecale]|uniref:hypothetical protein n=1 Tax=Flavobacterium faecale TaxID=1355330 RepID=UPI003AB09820
MKVFLLFMLCLTIPSCATKKYTDIRQLPDGIKSTIEEKYEVVNSQKKLLYKKEQLFTKNGRIKYSKTLGPSGNIIQETEKKLWFVVEKYPDKESYYCKTRWKPKQRERISCYTRKQHKQNEAIYHYNTDGTIAKIVDNFTTFYTHYYYYINNELNKIIIKDKNDKLVDEIIISCITKDKKGSCTKETRISTQTNHKEELLFFPIYDH